MAAPKQLILIEKVTARVFCHHGGGGNPVTIFAAPRQLPSRRQRERLAQTCDWESVFVGLRRDGGNNIKSFRPPPQMAFHMPTGEQVSFCAHAAMGGSLLLLPSLSSKDNNGKGGGGRLYFATAPMQDEEEENGNHDPTSFYHATILDSNDSKNNLMVALEMDGVPWTEEPLTSRDEALVRSMLRKFHNVVVLPSLEDDPDAAVGTTQEQQPPSFCNSSVARPKTLVRVEHVHEARAPTTAPDLYREACDAIDSTGLYLYAEHPTEEGAWECVSFLLASEREDNKRLCLWCARVDYAVEATFFDGTAKHKMLDYLISSLFLGDSSFCLLDSISHWCMQRQFPRASGYPEDPATGIAAAALACSLRYHHQETIRSSYKFYQGFAMGQPSLIVVENLELRNVVSDGDYCASGRGDWAASGTASFRLKGKVEVDERETIEIDEDMDPQ